MRHERDPESRTVLALQRDITPTIGTQPRHIEIVLSIDLLPLPGFSSGYSL